MLTVNISHSYIMHEIRNNKKKNSISNEILKFKKFQSGFGINANFGMTMILNMEFDANFLDSASSSH